MKMQIIPSARTLNVFNKLIPEHDSGYLHDEEGDDDMPAHLKASLLRASVMIPMRHGELAPGNEDILFMNVILAPVCNDEI